MATLTKYSTPTAMGMRPADTADAGPDEEPPG